MFFKFSLAFRRTPPCDTYVERLSNDRLCFVRKRRHSSQQKQRKYIEVYEDEPESAPSNSIKHHVHKHNHEHTHQHFVHYENPHHADHETKGKIAITESKPPCASPTPLNVGKRPQDRPPSPSYEIREPGPRKDEYSTEYERIPVRKVRLGKVRLEKPQVEKVQVRRAIPSPRCETREEGGLVRMPSTSAIPTRFGGMEEIGKAMWDEHLHAYVIKRAPRVRFPKEAYT
ncbi:hypothetical protein LTR99_001274 [Exophiala xenobiotica]|uniref:Uncharacterized protein n=1 Tax=Vermiconidia calcicola TaxID=1690605 RepID=A0AAV9QL17_9PEZI|nr:hypothetical protein LTR96_003395 [Exophiala xenobiotica]KAK5545836.1 hypothetical protein LTR25_000846 [Vermiconidia calcicola]KAK5549903.1 hypothetical protein LTR23_000194 [Chaetothyriales sp. CCFEE 6169]KAK5280827.1 hypothetical protein LTR40_005797 [Exophiala xenobiotica]KAK5308299.1 hypothetical protein LTR99_001274 [Exophiala xenobiotica]